MDQLFLPLKRYAQFDGRANRREYWMFQLFMLIVSVVLMVPMITALVLQSDGLGIASIILFWLATLLPVIAVTVRRLHDCNQSGWLYLLAFIPFGGLVIFVFTLLPGTPEANPYGPVPPELG